tara:strand:- start:10563 stop:10760 length:198 start_codon:yes stop_codon:yes gene_type:complete
MTLESDIFILGSIHCLKSIMKAIKDTGEGADDIDFDEVLDTQRRNLSDPKLEEMIMDVADLEKFR